MSSFQVIKDRHLFAVVCLLVMVDVIYLAVWQVMDPMTRTVMEFSQEVRGIERFSCQKQLVLHQYASKLALGLFHFFIQSEVELKANVTHAHVFPRFESTDR